MKKQGEWNTRLVKMGYAGVIVLFVGIILFSVRTIMNKMEDSAVTTSQLLLTRLSENLEISMQADEDAIQYFSSMINLEDQESAKKELKKFVTDYNFLDAYYVGEDGNSYNGDGIAFDSSIFPVLDKETLGYSDAFNGSFGMWETIYCAEVNRENSTMGHIYVRIAMNKYEKNSAMTFYGENGMAYLFDANTKKIVLMPATPSIVMAYMQDVNAVFTQLGFDEEEMETEVYPAIAHREQLVIQGSLQGQRVYLTLLSFPSHDSWYICGIVPASAIQQESGLILKILSAVLICMGIIMVLILYLVIREMRHRAQTRLKHLQEIEMQNAIYDTIGNASDTVLCVFNCETKRCETIFHNIVRILGIEVDEFLADMTKLKGLMDGADEHLYERMLQGKIHNQEVYLIEYEHPKQHEVRDIRLSIKNLEIQGKECYMLMMEDITQDVKIQESLHVALDNATQANQAKSDFLSHMSHEIRTPINAIIGMREIAAHHLEEPEKVKDCLHKIELSSTHLLELINDILDLSKIESGKLSMHNQSFLLSDCFSNVVSIIQTQAEAKHQNFHLETKEIIHDQLIGDEMRVKQILINLLNNAVKYTPEGGDITLGMEEVDSLHKAYSKFIFTIRDNGVGMSKAFLERIGKPFEQETNVFHKNEAGTGLGLSIVKNVIAIMGGTFFISSKPQEGTTIKVELSFQQDERVRYPLEKKLRDYRVLIVDDDEQVLQDVKQCLKEFHMECDLAHGFMDGFLQLQQAKEQHHLYDVAIIDWKMPDGNGIELTKKIRSSISKDLPVIFISAYDWSDIEKEARSAGVFDFIEKPLFTKRLYDALAKLLEKETSSKTYSMENLKGKRVLVVEDNELNREIAKELLEMQGMNVEMAINGAEAVEKFAASPINTFDLILMDLQMPIMDGCEASKEIRSLKREDAESIVIIAMTANAFSEDVIRCTQAGMNAHLGKPIEVNTMYACISEQLRRNQKG